MIISKSYLKYLKPSLPLICSSHNHWISNHPSIHPLCMSTFFFFHFSICYNVNSLKPPIEKFSTWWLERDIQKCIILIPSRMAQHNFVSVFKLSRTQFTITYILCSYHPKHQATEKSYAMQSPALYSTGFPGALIASIA